MQTRPLPETSDARSPAGAEIRYLMGGTTGDMIHSTVPPGQVNRATVHATVSEFWHVLSGRGEIWRRDESGEKVTAFAVIGLLWRFLLDANLGLVNRVLGVVGLPSDTPWVTNMPWAWISLQPPIASR